MLLNFIVYTWKLKINYSKTKVVNIKFKFSIGTEEIEILDSYKYLGVFFSKSGSFNKAKIHFVQQANKTRF